MRLVRISDLSEEERKKALEEQQARLEANRQASEQARQNANDRFNELVSRTGGNNNSKHTTSINEIVRTMKNSGASEERISTFKRNNRATLWDSVLDTMNGIGKVGENTLLGLNNGIKNLQQTLGRRITEPQTSRADFWNEQNKEILEEIKKDYPEEKEKIEKAINNPLISGEKIREEEKTITAEIQSKIDNNTEKINKNIEEIDNPVLKKIAEISPSIGQMVPSFVPGAGAVYAAGSATGQYYNDAKQRGMTDEEANMYSGIMGLVEGGTEMIGVKNLSKAGKGIKAFVKGAGKEAAKETTEQVSKSVLKNALKDYGIGIADNVMQEALIDPIDEVVSYGVSGKTKYDYSTTEGWKQLGNDMLQDGINGGLVSAILGGANLGIQSCTGVVQKYRNNQTITENEFKTAVKDAGKKLDVQKMVVSGVEQQVNKYKDYYSNKPVDSSTQNWLNKAENIINQNAVIDANNNQTINNDTNLQNNINTSNMNLEDSAKAYNLDTNNETIKTVSKALSNRGITGRFDASYFKNNNENAIWRTSTDENGNTTREVIFNPNGNSQDTMQQISIHELTHDLAATKEFDELKSLVLDRNKTMQGYTEARHSLENTYSQVYDPNSENFKSLVDDEEVADTLAQKLGDQDFVNSLSTEKPTVFKRIYDWVVDKVNKITGNKIEKVYWEDIKNKFETAYRQTYQGENSNQTRYSIQKDNNGNQYVKVDTDQDIFEGKEVKDYPKIAKQYILNQFRDGDKNINLPTKEDVTVTSKTAREYTHPKKQLPQKVKESKMKASTELDNLISISEYQYSRPDDGRHEFAKDGWDYYKTQFEIDGNTFEGLVNIAKSGNKKTLYDITNIKRINQNHSTSAKAFSTSLVNSNNSITLSQDNVNTTNQSMQNNENNTLNVPTKKLTDKQRQNRLEYLRNIDTSNMKFLEKHQIKSEIRALENGYNSVEEMRKAENESKQETANNNDIILQRKAIANKLKDKGANVDKDGNVTLYHITTQDNYNQINKDGYFKPNDSPIGGMTGEEVGPRSFFSYDKDWVETWRQSANSKVIEIKVPAEYIRQGAKNEKEIYIEGILKRRDNGIWTTDKLPTSTFYDRMAVKEYQKQKTSKLAEKESENNSGSFNLSKEQQLEIIQKTNPMLDDYHTGIRTVDDIKTFREAYDIAKKEASDGGWDEYASYPDITNEMIENSLKTGNITVYSSNDIKNGTFVTPSYEQALEYAGNDSSKVKSKKVKVDDVAWINLDEGQYAKIDKNNNQSKLSIKESNAWQKFLDSQIGQRGEGKTVQELRLPTKETLKNEKIDSYNVLYQDNAQISTINLPVSEGGKVRKHYKTIMQSSNTSPEAKAIAKELMGTDTYVPDSNERQLKVADDRIERNGADNEAVALATKVKNGDKITAEDIATGERLIEYYSKIGDKEKLQDSIQNVALAGTQAGQAVQAMSLINRQTPQGQAVYLQKVIDKMNSDIDKRTKGKGKKFELTPEMIEKITNSSKENLESNIDEVARELANQVPKTTIEKIDSWRYFSMLANPRTHIRNIIGNLSMASVQTVKNKVAGGLEAIAQKTGMIDKRSKTLKPASKETRKFAKADVDNVLSRLNNESKFDTRNLIQQYQRTFKSNLLENTLGKLYNFNSKALEKEDIFGLKRAYRKSLADYITANKLTESDLTAGTREADIQLEKARKYAIEQAQEATFHQQSAMASILNTFENKSTATRLITGAVIPFKKTPINVAKTGASYSPLGLVKSFTLDVANLKNGKITANQYIDNLAKGLTGTGIAAAGYALAQAGILSASGDEDDQKNQYYQEDRGNQPFSLRIGDKTYSLDWLAPTAIPLFIGAELNNNIKNSNEEQTAEDILDRISNGIDAMSSAMNPMIEMSMLSGLASTIKSFSQGDTQVFQNLAINAGKSYINQFFPTLGGQIAKIVDDTERSTTSTKKNAFAKAVDSTGKQILNKIPFASQLLSSKTDVWGNTLKRDSNPFYRALQQTTFPWTEKNLKSTDVDNAISDLYEETGEKSVLPNTSINKDFTLNGEKYRLTAEEYAEYKKQYGKNSYNLLNGLTRSKEYKNMNNEQKTEAISKVYEYANEKNKVDYANKNKVEIETSSLYNTVTSIEEEGGKGSDYFKYLGKITGVEKSEEKIKILEESDIPSKSKSSIYTNTVGKSDDFYSNVLKESNININEYLKYKQQKFESDREDDGTLEGKTVTNSKKKKVYNYVNGMNITYNQKLLILGKQYKLSDSEQKKLYQYINTIPGQTSDEKLEIFKMYTNNFQIYKDGTMSFK